MFKYLFFCTFFLFTNCKTKPADLEKPIAFFEGIWKAKNSNQFEIWEWSSFSGTLNCKVIQVNNGKEIELEKMKIFMREGVLVYKKTSAGFKKENVEEYKQVDSPENVYRFENQTIRYPVIEYIKISNSEMKIAVEEKNGKRYESSFFRKK